MPTLLQMSLWLPEELRDRLGSSRKGSRERGPISEQWITTLSDEEDGQPPQDPPAGTGDA
jgi:hypothetical protein